MSTPQPKLAVTERPIHPLLAQRYSPYVFDPKPVEREKLLACLEAARWAASSFNEQPWSFLVAERTNEPAFARMVDCLMEANQGWAARAGVLLLTVICRTFARNGKPNRVAEHDLGLAVGNLTFQALSLGLFVHEMGGVELAKARAVYGIPDTHEPYTAIALGYPGETSQASPALAQRELAPRTRKPLTEFVFQDGWRQVWK